MSVKGSIVENDVNPLVNLSLVSKNSNSKEQIVVERIRWKKFTTTAIDLRVMCESDSDKLSMILSEVPKSMQFSIQKDLSKDKSAAQQLLDRGYSYKQDLRDSLLQITIKDRTIIYDLDPDAKKSKEESKEVTVKNEPKELFLLNATSHFIPLQMYVEVGLKIIKCKDNL